MQNHTRKTTSSLLHSQQALLLRKHLLVFVAAQEKATQALRAINEIAMLENENNPLQRPLLGTPSVVGYADLSYTPELIHAEEVDALLTEALRAIEVSAFWASND